MRAAALPAQETGTAGARGGLLGRQSRPLLRHAGARGQGLEVGIFPNRTLVFRPETGVVEAPPPVVPGEDQSSGTPGTSTAIAPGTASQLL